MKRKRKARKMKPAKGNESNWVAEMNGNGKKRKAIGFLGGFLVIAVVLLCLRSCSLQKENEELKLLNQMNQDQKELNCLYESGDFTDETWLMNYREIGLRF